MCRGVDGVAPEIVREANGEFSTCLRARPGTPPLVRPSRLRTSTSRREARAVLDEVPQNDAVPERAQQVVKTVGETPTLCGLPRGQELVRHQNAGVVLAHAVLAARVRAEGHLRRRNASPSHGVSRGRFRRLCASRQVRATCTSVRSARDASCLAGWLTSSNTSGMTPGVFARRAAVCSSPCRRTTSVNARARTIERVAVRVVREGHSARFPWSVVTSRSAGCPLRAARERTPSSGPAAAARSASTTSLVRGELALPARPGEDCVDAGAERRPAASRTRCPRPRTPPGADDHQVPPEKSPTARPPFGSDVGRRRTVRKLRRTNETHAASSWTRVCLYRVAVRPELHHPPRRLGHVARAVGSGA